jgi:mannose-1-phosphate guanylyltransferase
MDDASSHQNLWSVVLAGGEGERLKPFVRELLGYEKPKQYCTFVGTRSMLQHTLDRSLRGPITVADGLKR